MYIIIILPQSPQHVKQSMTILLVVPNFSVGIPGHPLVCRIPFRLQNDPRVPTKKHRPPPGATGGPGGPQGAGHGGSAMKIVIEPLTNGDFWGDEWETSGKLTVCELEHHSILKR